MSRILVAGYRLIGRRSGASISLLELGAFLEARGHEVRYAALTGDGTSELGQPVVAGRHAVRFGAGWAQHVIVRDEQQIRSILPLLRANRPTMVVHSHAGAPQELGVDLSAVRAVIWVAGHVRDRVTQARGAWLGPEIVIDGLPLDPSRFRTTPGERVTLVNLSNRKGGPLFRDLVERMPDTAFLGVRAWGDQVPMGSLPNNTVVMDFVADPRIVYGQTRILLAPSAAPGTIYAQRLPAWGEAWCRVPVEAGFSGIPTIAHPSAGVHASIGDAATYVDRDDVDGWIAAIRRLQDPSEHAAAGQRALARAEEWAGQRAALLDLYEDQILDREVASV